MWIYGYIIDIDIWLGMCDFTVNILSILRGMCVFCRWLRELLSACVSVILFNMLDFMYVCIKYPLEYKMLYLKWFEEFAFETCLIFIEMNLQQSIKWEYMNR